GALNQMLPSRVLSLRKDLFQFAACPLVLVMGFVTAGIQELMVASAFWAYGSFPPCCWLGMICRANSVRLRTRRCSTPACGRTSAALLALFSLLGGIVIGAAYFFGHSAANRVTGSSFS